ncbi:MAG: hypothetical protein WBE76_14280 [Terracidiphilus sp.]
MQGAATEAVPQSFVGMLASLAVPAKPSGQDPNDGFADDVAVFSYESALQSRIKNSSSSGAVESSPPQLDAPTPPSADFPASKLTITEAEAQSPRSPLQDRKAASITIRVSASECAQLRARAAESGMTVSAYLRSCIFEVESLRAQVKDALAQLRSAVAGDDRQPTQVPAKPGPLPAHGWRSRLLPGWKIGRRLETA